MNPSTANNPLSQLRDLHLPTPVGFWPLAPGWYILIALGLLLLAWFGWHYYQQKQRQRFQLRILAELTHYLQQQPPLWADVNILLKRVAFIHHTRAAIAGLSGESWLIWLDNAIKTDVFSQGIGRILLTGPYQPTRDHQIIDIESISRLLTHATIVLLTKPSLRHKLHYHSTIAEESSC